MTEPGFLRKAVSGDGIKARLIRGSTWTILGFGGGQFLRFASNLILTRILFPEAFGLMALVQVCLIGLVMFSDLGLRASIIQSPRGDDADFLNTAWTVQIARGALLWLIACAIAAPVAAFYKDADPEGQLAQLLPVAGLGTLIDGFLSTRFATANRHLLLGRVTAIELGSQALGIISMTVLALLTGSVWSLVFGSLVAALGKVLASHLLVPGLPNRLRFQRDAFGEIFHFGKYLFIGTIAGFLINQGDRALLGRFVGLDDLAYYNIGWFLASVPLMLTRQFADRVYLPLYRAKPPTESEENRRKICQTRMLMTAGLFALGLPLALGGDLFVRLLYDERYHQAGPMVILLSLAFLPSIISASYGSLILAQGNSRAFSGLLIFSAVIRISVLYFGIRDFGLVGAAFTPALAELLVYPVRVAVVRRHGGWDPRHDALFAVASVAIGVLAVYLNMDALQEFVGGG